MWSAITIQVGTPPQSVSVLPSTAMSETWVVGLDGCDGIMQCANARGGLFLANESSTFSAMGSYALGLDYELGFGGKGYFGSDGIALR